MGDDMEARVGALSRELERMREEVAGLREAVARLESRRDGEVVRSVSDALGRAANRRHRVRGNVS